MRAFFAAALLTFPSALGLAPEAQRVTHLPAGQVEAAFKAGRPLLETGAYKVHASRRDGAGLAEVHVRDTDIIYVLTGSATIVTGGTVTRPQTVAPDEIRGPAIDGGESRTIQPGDVLIVPAGTPHWFSAVPGPLTYYVVKVTAMGGGAR